MSYPRNIWHETENVPCPTASKKRSQLFQQSEQILGAWRLLSMEMVRVGEKENYRKLVPTCFLRKLLFIHSSPMQFLEHGLRWTCLMKLMTWDRKHTIYHFAFFVTTTSVQRLTLHLTHSRWFMNKKLTRWAYETKLHGKSYWLLVFLFVYLLVCFSIYGKPQASPWLLVFYCNTVKKIIHAYLLWKNPSADRRNNIKASCDFMLTFWHTCPEFLSMSV